MENPLNLLFTNFTLNIPVWLVVILMALPCLLFYRYRASKLRIYGKLRFTEVTYNSLTVEWNMPIFPFSVPDHYKVHFRKHSEPESWDSITTRDDKCFLTITNLPIDTKYVVRVCACTNTEEGPFCDESSVISTKNLAFKVKDESTLRTDTMPNLIPVYDVPDSVESDIQLKVRVIVMGEVPDESPHQVHKSVLFVSLPHSGKTTLLQGIMNFIFGVSSSDDFRLGFAPEIKSDDYADWATVYRFLEYEGGRLGIPLTLIDTPRLQGHIKDHMLKIYEQLKYIVCSCELDIDCICFVAPANNISLNNEEVDFIQSIMYLFQTDSRSDMYCFFTFADAGPAHVKNVLESQDVRFCKSYFVNWSAFFQEACEFSVPFWRLNVDSLDDFFSQLNTSIPKTLRSSLEGTPPTPVKREELKSDIAALQPQISEDLSNVVQMQSTFETFKDKENDIKSTGDFSFTIEEIRQTKQALEPGVHVTNCMQCFFTCHENCGIPDDDEKIRCSSMRNGYCTVCTGHCIWAVHKNTPHTYHYTSVKVTKSYKEMKTNYEKEKGITLEFDAYLEQLNKDIKELLDRIRDKIKRITECKNELQGIKRSPLAGSFADTIDDMIKAEEAKKATGFEKRIEMFRELKRHSEKFKLIRIER